MTSSAPAPRPSAFWAVVAVMLVLVALEEVHEGLGVIVALVLTVLLVARAFARMARRETSRGRR